MLTYCKACIFLLKILFILSFFPLSVQAAFIPFFSKNYYKAELKGDLPSDVKERIESLAKSFDLKDRPPSSPEMLTKRAKSDLLLIEKILRSEGFYAAEVKLEIDLDSSPYKLSFIIDTGPAYLLDKVSIEALDREFSEDNLPSLRDIGLRPGYRARASEIMDAVELIERALKEGGFPFPDVFLKEVLLDHKEGTLSVEYAFNAKDMAFFNELEIKGLKRVKEGYIQNRVPWEKGAIFKQSELDVFRTRLMQNSLFTIVDISYSERTDGSLELPVNLSLVERSPRTIKAGAFYETDTGSGVRLGWEHRNLGGMGEFLSQDYILAEKQKRFGLEYKIPDFFNKNQSLSNFLWLGKEESDAYESEGGAFGSKLFRQLAPSWSCAFGFHYRISEVRQRDESQTVGLLSFPLELSWDVRNNILDPVRGMRIQWKAEPFADTLDIDTWFVRLMNDISAHMPLIGENTLVLSARGSFGFILGESDYNLPADERFYAGGGGSIRGYSYQSVGPEKDGVVVGGRSIFETGLELRLRMKNNFGLVAFLDGGQVFKEAYLQFEEQFHWGAGLGLRYYTDFAPFRFDIAFPLNARDKDDPFQLYISIGQAF